METILSRLALTSHSIYLLMVSMLYISLTISAFFTVIALFRIIFYYLLLKLYMYMLNYCSFHNFSSMIVHFNHHIMQICMTEPVIVITNLYIYYTPTKQTFLGVYWNQSGCLSILYLCVCHKILISVKALVGILSHT